MTHWLLIPTPPVSACGEINARALPVTSAQDPNILKIDCEK